MSASSNVENLLISKVIESGDYTAISDNQITAKYLSGRHKKALRFIQDFMLKYGKVPSQEVFEKKMPNYELVETSESLDYYCDEVRNKVKHNEIVDTIEEVSTLIEELETDEAIRALNELVTNISNEYTKTDRVILNKNTQSRMDAYNERAKSGGITGIPSGIDRLDHILSGFNDEELIILIAFTGMGKTWFEAILAVWMAKNGYKVLFFTTEMSSDAITRRIDAVWCKLHYTRFTKGQLMPDELRRFETYLEKLEGDEDTNLIIEQVNMGVTEISSKIDQHKPDMVFVDGAYLLEDEAEGEDDWRAQVRIFRGLKRIARAKKVPIFASTQSKTEKANLSSIAFASHIKADADVILGLSRDEEMKEDKEIAIVPLKTREAESNARILMNWDFNKMDYSTIYMEGADGRRAGDDLKSDNEQTSNVSKSVMVV